MAGTTISGGTPNASLQIDAALPQGGASVPTTTPRQIITRVIETPDLSAVSDYTLVLADAFKHKFLGKATAITLTIPPNSSVAFPINTEIEFERTAAGIITVTPGVAVTINSTSGGYLDTGLYNTFSIKKTGTNTWDLYNGKKTANITNVSLVASSTTFTNLASGIQELTAGTTFRFRTKFDGSNYTQCRIVVGCSVVGSANTVVYPQWSTDDTNFTTLGSGATTDTAQLDVIGTKVSSWITLPSGAQADVFWRVVTQGGDGVADPVVGTVMLQFKL